MNNNNNNINENKSPEILLKIENEILTFGKSDDNLIPNISKNVSSFDLNFDNNNNSNYSNSNSNYSAKFGNLNEIEIKSNKKTSLKNNINNILISKNKINSLNNNNNNFLNKKRKILTSEELELEKIKKEKEEIKKQNIKNKILYIKSKNFIPISITPSPLTLIKPFNLSSSKNKNYIKNRLSSNNFEINKLNEKIKE